MGPTGSEQVLGVDDMAGVRTASNGGENDFIHPAWSPRGDRFAYDTLNVVPGAPDSNGLRVHVADFEPDAPTGPAGRDDTIVEFDPKSDDEGWPIWSPDGSRVAFQAYDEEEARLVIMSVPAEGPVDTSPAVVSEAFMSGDLGARIEAGEGPGLLYAWAPDGSALVLVNAGQSDHPAYLMDASSGELQPLGWASAEWPSSQPNAG
jgi:Tol biopolymer transport system component